MLRIDWKTVLLFLLAAALLFVAVTRIAPISKMRNDMDLEAANPFETGDWSSELRIPNAALSIFRSLAIDYLWIRADNLKNDGQYFDALHLARLICALQPNLPSVWIFNAWNMAYNISVGLPAGPERWNWVRAGFELLRDEALVYNKTSLKLYNELSWIFQHKIGGITDDDHRYYKLRLAYEMMPLFGIGTTEEIQALAESPRRWDAPSSPPFRQGDFLNPATLLLKIRNDENNAVERYIYNHFTADFRQRLDEFDETSTELPKAMLLDLVKEFNLLLLDEGLYDQQRFADVKLSDEIQQMLALNPRSWSRIPLNRFLLEAAFAEEITQAQRYRLNDDEDIAEILNILQQAEPSFNSPQDVVDGLSALLYDPSSLSNDLLSVLPELSQRPAFRRLALFVRSQKLRLQWKIEPVWMLIINRMYGPVDYDNPAEKLSLDWRSAYVHSIYWAVRGLQYSDGQMSFDELNLQRKIYHSLQALFHYGNMQIYAFAAPEYTQTEEGQEIITRTAPPEPRVFLSQDMRMFPVAYQSTLDIIKSRTDQGEEAPPGVVDGSINLLRAGIVNLYLSGHEPMARYYYAELQQREPQDPDHQGSLERFVRGRIREEAEQIGPKGASNYINAMLRDSYARYALGDDENASIREQLALQIRDLFESEFTDENNDRIILPDFGELKWIALRDFLNDPAIEDAVKGTLLQRMQIESPRMYERVISEFERQRNAESVTP